MDFYNYLKKKIGSYFIYLNWEAVLAQEFSQSQQTCQSLFQQKNWISEQRSLVGDKIYCKKVMLLIPFFRLISRPTSVQ